MSRWMTIMMVAMAAPAWAQSHRSLAQRQQPTYIRCPNFESRASEAVRMIQDLAGVPQPLQQTLASKDGSSFRLLRTPRNEIQIKVTDKGPRASQEDMAGYVCQLSDGSLQIKLVHDFGHDRVISMRAIDSRQVQITQVVGAANGPRDTSKKSTVYSVQ